MVKPQLQTTRPAKDIKEALLGGNLVSLKLCSLILCFYAFRCELGLFFFLNYLMNLPESLYIVIRLIREIYIIVMVTKETLQKNLNSPGRVASLPGRAWLTKKKRGGVKSDFTPSSPILFKTHQRLPKDLWGLHFCSNFKLFLHLCVIYSCIPFIPLK